MFSSEGIPEKERFECWRELIGRSRDSEVTSDHSADFRAEMRRLELGPVTLLRTSFPPTRFHRTARRVQRSDQETFHLTLLLGGGFALSRGTEPTVILEPGKLHMLDSSHSFDLRSYGSRAEAPSERRVEAVGIDFPISLLPLPPHRLQEVLGRGFSSREGTSALLTDFIVGLDRQAAALGPVETPRLGGIVIDLVSAWIARELDAEATVPDDSRQRALVENVRAFIGRNLHDPELTPAVIAATHHISVSYLHRLFTRRSDGETVAAFIRRHRLERAHRDLADPALRALPVQTVAVRCGLPRASEFSRAFKAAYGLSPREHRRRTLGGPAHGRPAYG
ncbi:AraC family transcriptional regulator [Streptomyces sp. CBMA156]|nr:AraC family transcriptional regulator [Streptomyces sp. CBMA156]MBD0676771.1 AraC family transcriptional regulator [Streptomyces sp. CBMA156]